MWPLASAIAFLTAALSSSSGKNGGGAGGVATADNGRRGQAAGGGGEAASSAPRPPPPAHSGQGPLGTVPKTSCLSRSDLVSWLRSAQGPQQGPLFSLTPR